MTKIKFIFFTRAFILFSILNVNAVAAVAKEIDSAHRICLIDNDCQVLTIGCACIHNSTCAAATDLKDGFVSSVNKKYSDQYKSLSACTSNETKHCATAGPCASHGKWQPKCQNQKCEIIFEN